MKILYILIIIFSMPKISAMQLHAPSKEEILLFKYRTAIMEFEPFNLLHYYTMAHPKERRSLAIQGALSSYVKDIAEQAYSLRAKKLHSYGLGNELSAAFDAVQKNDTRLFRLASLWQSTKRYLKIPKKHRIIKTRTAKKTL